ncbi:anti-sigma factor [Marinobacter confluentis]|uniref:Anti-sigma factor n=1 Tax=Marinobacter confluentis TaxID=1697557 RepID=A0A4Z1C564_9GAMM|nr:hypothetical protein [Marinobacter confluentis]TGN40410.1 hypothetical protein E5Q11_09080 [Marinobacter confluentis]
MNDHDFEKIMAYADQELEPDQVADVEKLLAEDTEARDFLARLRESDQLISGGLDSILDEPVPQRLIDAARGQSAESSSESDTGSGQSARVVEFPKKPAFSRWAYATAASVTLLVAAGAFILSPGDSRQGTLAEALNEALEQTPSGSIHGQPDDTVQVMPVATFQTAEAGICRQFAAQVQGQQTVGLACRSGQGQWQIRAEKILAEGENGQSYAPASGGSGPVADALSDLRGGEPLSAGQEQSLISDGWE